MGETEPDREKEEIVKQKGWYVPSLHGKILDKTSKKE